VPLDPQVQAVLDVMADTGFTFEGVTAEELRARANMVVPSPIEVASITDATVPGPAGDIPVRIYRPSEEDGLPVVVFFHGGGWVIGDLESHDHAARAIASKAGCVVVAVDYRLAPEHRFPAAYDDAVAALDWVAGHAAELAIDPARLGIGGDSAGGNLAAAAALAARDRGRPSLKAQILIYPLLDRHDGAGDAQEAADAPLLAADEIRFAIRGYSGDDALPADPRAVPLLAEDFSGLPHAAILAAEADLLLGDAERYAAALQAAGVPVDFEVAKGVVHGFLRARRMSPESARGFTWLCEAARRRLAG
jgi:acetyl esterase